MPSSIPEEFAAPPLVFLDTTALKFASERIVRGRERPVTIKVNGRDVTYRVKQYVEIFPNASARPQQQQEIQWLPFIAYLAKSARLRLTTHIEVLIEFWNIPKTDDSRGRFYGAPIENAKGPFEYSRAWGGAGVSDRDPQFEFVLQLRHTRFDQLKKAVGANAESTSYKNQLLDAFHLLCAESERADYFLTLDEKLIRHVRQHKRWPPTVQVVNPTELVGVLCRRNVVRWRDRLGYARERRALTRHPPKAAFHDLVVLGQRLEKSGCFDD